MIVIKRSKAGDRIDEEQRRVPRIVDCLSNGSNRRDRSGRCLVVHNADGLDLMRFVFGQIGFDKIRVCATAPITLDELGFQLQFFGDPLPQGRKMSGLKHQHPVPG